MAIIFFIPGLYFVDNILIITGAIYSYPYAFFIVQILASIFPVSVYYYIHLLLTDNKKYNKILFAGSFLLLIYVVYLTIDFSTLTFEQESLYLSGLDNEEDYPISMMLYTVFFYAWQMVYFVVLVFDVRKYRLSAENSFSNFDRIKIDYVKKLMTLLGVLNFGLILFYLFLPMPLVDYGLLPSVVSVIYLFIMYYALKHDAIFSKESYEDLIKENSVLSVVTGEGNDISEKLALLGKKIEEILVGQKAYKNPDLRLELLAEKLNEPPYLVSQALNKHFHKTFYEVTNQLRIDEAMLRLKDFDSSKYTIEALAFDVGFNSRAAFYRSFKRFTGKSPGDFIHTNV